MKNTFVLFLFIILFGSFTDAQGWESKKPWQELGLKAVKYLNDEVGYAVGYAGTIFKTTDGGITWNCKLAISTINPNETFWSNDLDFYDENNGIIVGYNFYHLENGSIEYRNGILHTSDGGDSWQELFIEVGISCEVNNVVYTDSNNISVIRRGIIANDLCRILSHSSNGGKSWVNQFYGLVDSLWIEDISFFDQNNGIILGYDTNDFILKTTDGGNSWVKKYCGKEMYGSAISYIDTNNIVIINDYGSSGIDYGEIFRTTDGGKTWENQSAGGNYRLKKICFTDINNGTIIGYEGDYNNGIILHTTDGGKTWKKKYNNENYSLRGINFSSESNGSVVGTIKNNTHILGDLILHTTDGGKTWTEQSTGSSLSLGAINFIDDTTGTMVGNSIYHTTDGGATWLLQNSGTNNYLNGVFFADTYYGVAVGKAGTIINTTDGGNNWVSQSSGTSEDLLSVYAALALNSINYYIVGSGGTILNYTDNSQGGTRNWTAGKNFENVNFLTNKNEQIWQNQNSGTSNDLYGIEFSDSIKGFVVGSNGTILHTINGGIDWINQQSNTNSDLYALCNIDENNCSAVGSGGIILMTTDGGNIWNNQTSGTTNDLNCVAFLDSNNGIVVGDKGTVLRTINGGEEWTAQVIGTTNDLNGVIFTDINNGTIVGEGGTIFKTTDGGVTFVEKENSISLPKNITLNQNYPNPFNPSTMISYQLPMNSFVTLKVYDLLGQEVATLVNEQKPAGNYEVKFDASNLASGVYLYKLQAGEFTSVKKLILMK